jgi:hypothetical protein
VARCLASFKAIPRAAAAAAEVPEAAGSEPVSPEDRRRRAIEREKDLHERALASLPEGWTSERSERLLVVSHASERRAERFVEQAEAVLEWLDDTFPYVGPENYVRAPILRVCKDADELASIKKGSSYTTWGGADIEILCCAADTTSGQYDVVNQRVMEIWFRERDARLYASFPPWISSGLRDMLADSRQKRGSIEFKEDDSDRANLREAIRAGTLAAPAALLQMSREQFFDDSTSYAALPAHSSDFWPAGVGRCVLLCSHLLCT